MHEYLLVRFIPKADVSIRHIGRIMKSMYASQMIRILALTVLAFLAGCSAEPKPILQFELFETCFSKDVFFKKGEHPDQKYAGIITAYIRQDGQLDLQSPPKLRSPRCSNVHLNIALTKIKERAEILGKIEIKKGNDRLFCSGDVCGLRSFELSMVFVGDGKFSITEAGRLPFEVTNVKQLEVEDPKPGLFSLEELETYVRVIQGQMRGVNPNYCTIDCTD